MPYIFFKGLAMFAPWWSQNPQSITEDPITGKSFIVLVETLTDCSPKPRVLCTLKTKIKKIYPLKSYTHTTVFYSWMENSGRTSQSRRFPMEHSWVSTKTKYITTAFNSKLRHEITLFFHKHFFLRPTQNVLQEKLEEKLIDVSIYQTSTDSWTCSVRVIHQYINICIISSTAECTHCIKNFQIFQQLWH